MMTAEDLMTENPVTIPVMAKVREAVRLLHNLDVRHLPVVDESGALVGILSDRDVRGLAFPEVLGAEYSGEIQTTLDAPISTIMSADVICVDVEADAAEIVDLMLDYKIGAVPVVDGDGVLVGIVSYVDVLRKMPLDEEEAWPAKKRASKGRI